MEREHMAEDSSPEINKSSLTPEERANLWGPITPTGKPTVTQSTGEIQEPVQPPSQNEVDLNQVNIQAAQRLETIANTNLYNPLDLTREPAVLNQEVLETVEHLQDAIYDSSLERVQEQHLVRFGQPPEEAARRQLEVRLEKIATREEAETEPLLPLDVLIEEVIKLDGLARRGRATERDNQKLERLYIHLERYNTEKTNYHKSKEITNVESKIENHIIERLLNSGVPREGNNGAISQARSFVENLEQWFELKEAIKRTQETIKLEEGRVKMLRSSSNIKKDDIKEVEDRIERYRENIEQREEEARSELTSIEQKVTGIGFTDFMKSDLLGEWEKIKINEEDEETEKLKRRIDFRRYQQEKEQEQEIDRAEELEKIPFSELRPLLQVLEIINKAEKINVIEMDEKSLVDVRELNRAYLELERYLYEAQKRDITTDLKDSLESFYADYGTKLTDPKVFTEFMTVYERYHDRRCGGEVEERGLRLLGLSENEIEKFRGISHEYLTRGLWKIDAARINSVNPDRQPIEIAKLVGDWAPKESDLRLFEDTLYLKLSNDNLKIFKKAIDQYVDHLIYGSARFDYQEIIRGMDKLSQALELYGHAGLFSGKDVVSELKKLRQQAENRLFMYAGQFAAVRGLTEPLCGLMDRWAMDEGTERLQLMPRMKNGFVGLAMAFAEIPEFILLFRPEGHRGQIALNKDAQDFLRHQMEDKMIEKLAGRRIKGFDDPVERERNLSRLTKEMSLEAFVDQFEENPIKIEYEQSKNAAELAESYFRQATGKEKEQWGEISRRAKVKAEKTRQNWEALKEDAKEAMETVIQLFDVTGRRTKLGAPSFIMDNGDYIRAEDATAFYKFAILKAAGQAGRTVAEIREAGRTEAFKSNAKPGEYYSFGLSDAEIKAFEEADLALRTNGFSATLEIDGVTYKFEDIIKMQEVKYVPNNFLAIDHNLREKLSSSDLRQRVDIMRGKQGWMGRILNRLFPGKTPDEVFNLTDKFQGQLDLFADAIESSRSFHVMVWQMAHVAATREKLLEANTFTTDRLSMGPMNMPLALKRFYFQDYYLNNERERISRGERIVPAIPIAFYDFVEAMGTDNMLEAIQVIDKGDYDSYEMQRYYFQIKDMQALRGALEGDVDDKEGRIWGFFEKLLRDGTRLWTIIEHYKHLDSGAKTFGARKETMNQILEIFSPFKQVSTIIEKLYANDRGGSGSGAAWETERKLWVIQLDWLLSTLEGNARSAAGGVVYREILSYIEWLRDTDYITGEKFGEGKVYRSWLEEMWVLLNVAHGPGLPTKSENEA